MDPRGQGNLLDEFTEDLADKIEMIGEETAADLPRHSHAVTPGMRYLHCSRTIHQLVTDRNRAVGLYLAVASLLWTASAALLNVKEEVRLIVPLKDLKYWCMPVTFGVMTIFALFTSLLLIRTRIGLIYEVAKMNALLGLPVGRVQRINPLSLFFIMHLMICLAGAGTGLLFTYHLLLLAEAAHPMVWSVLVGLLIGVLLQLCYIGTVLHTTSDAKLKGAT